MEEEAGAVKGKERRVAFRMEECAWDAEMDAMRAAFGTDAPWRGKPARTFKHFGDHEIAIVYHDDNARGIPHAHIVVNNANLRTGYRMQTRHPEDLNRDLQDIFWERWPERSRHSPA